MNLLLYRFDPRHADNLFQVALLLRNTNLSALLASVAFSYKVQMLLKSCLCLGHCSTIIVTELLEKRLIIIIIIAAELLEHLTPSPSARTYTIGLYTAPRMHA